MGPTSVSIAAAELACAFGPDEENIYKGRKFIRHINALNEESQRKTTGVCCKMFLGEDAMILLLRSVMYN